MKQEIKFRERTTMRKLDFPWGNLAYTDSGPSPTPPLVFLPGTGCDTRDWAGVLSFLPSSHRCLCIDFRGHGESDTPSAPFTIGDLAQDVLTLAVQTQNIVQTQNLASVPNVHHGMGCILVGHSLGGMVALEALRRQADLASPPIRGLVLLEGWTSLTAAFQSFEGERHYGRLDALTIARIKCKWERTVGRFPPADWQAFWRTVETFDAWEILQAARAPIWEVYGGLGRTEQTVERLRVPDNPAIRWRWIEGAGHYLPQERPEDVAGVVGEAIADGSLPL